MTKHPRRRRPLVGAALTAMFAVVGVALLAAIATAGGLSPRPGGALDTAVDPTPAGTGSASPGPTAVATVPAADEAASVTDVQAAETPGATPTPLPAPSPPPVPAAYEPTENEAQPDAKRVGAAVAHRLTNYGPDSSVQELAASITADPEAQAALAANADAAHHAGQWSRGTVEYAQLGGHRNDKASIMVVVRQDIGTGATVERTATRTVDVRVARGEDGLWAFEALASVGGDPVPRPAQLSPTAAAVVDDPRIELPDSAIWDIYSGHTDEALLVIMAELAERTPYSAVVLHTGHPYRVFETERISNHSVGRAIDVYKLGSERVIDARDIGTFTHELVEWLSSRAEIKELGSPWKIEDAVAHTFTNEVHQDHIHIGVYPLS